VLVQDVAQESDTHANGAHPPASTCWQPPSPWQTAAGVPTRSTHVAAPHIVLGPTKTVHDAGVWPSHSRLLQTLFGLLIGQAGRVPTGGPAMVTQVPSELAVLHA